MADTTAVFPAQEGNAGNNGGVLTLRELKPMAEHTNISFAHHTGSPWIGCTKVNDDCLNCYADWLDEKRFSRTLGGATSEKPQRHWGKGKPRVRTVGFWNEARRFNEKPWVCDTCGESYKNKLFACCGTAELTRARMFPSLCDWLDYEVKEEWLYDFLKLVSECSNLTWMLFTKRPELFRKRLHLAAACADLVKDRATLNFIEDWMSGKPPEHVWVFGSAGNQKNANVILPELLKIPAVILGCSCEPMTGPVDFRNIVYTFKDDGIISELQCLYNTLDGTHVILNSDSPSAIEIDLPHLDVIIFGGESDQERPARPCDVEWIRNGVAQCRAADVLPYVKQLGSAAHDKGLRGEFAQWNYRLTKHKSGADINEWPTDLQVRELPKQH